MLGPFSARTYAFALAALLTACTSRPPGDSGETGTSTAGTGTDPTASATDAPTTDAPTTGTPTPTTTTAASTGLENTAEPCGIAGCDTFGTTGAVPSDCPGLKQLNPDCPDGFKCTIEGSIGATQCAPIMPRPKQLNEPCTVTGDTFSGIDDCDLGLLCWNPDDQGHGTCIGLCNSDDGGGTITCADPGAHCELCQTCEVGLCIAACNPLLHQCAPGEVCVPDQDRFLCAPDASGDLGQTHDPCTLGNSCDDGLLCLTPGDGASECDANQTGCCEPFCDTSNPECPGIGQTCVPWFDVPPPGFETLGICALQ